MDHLISSEDAATVLNISSSTLAKMRLSGKSPRYIKLGRRVAYRPSDLEAWVEAQSFASTSEYSEKGPANGN
ncbi:helix-turn-helix transcriptional regulator [Hoeflea sp.]|uniref:helix-turn-helix transcriptional regulator n=1 Tax=Hoeflea sp. TaxID=1940281 RepID=UPI003A8DC52B